MRIIRWMRATRPRRVVAGVLGFVLTAAVGAAAAWIVFTGVTGSGGGQVGSSSISPAITLAPNFQAADNKVIPGTTGDVYATITNNNTVSETINSLTAGTISASPSCSTSGLTFTVDPSVLGTAGTGPFAAGVRTHVHIGTLTAAASLDPACSNASLSIAFTGTTSP